MTRRAPRAAGGDNRRRPAGARGREHDQSRRAALQFWVPGQMDKHYVAGNDVDELMGYAIYTNFRRFTVNTDDALRKPPPERAARQ